MTNPMRSRQDFERPYITTPQRVIRFIQASLTTAKTLGIDASKWQGDINWSKAYASGVRFAIIKATEGTTITDDYLEKHWQGASAAGIVPGLYHFFRGNLSGVQQADHFLSKALPLYNQAATMGDNTLPAFVDVETIDSVSNSTRRAELLKCLDIIDPKIYLGVGVYTSPGFWNSYVYPMPEIQEYWQWVAHWTSASLPSLPMGWSWNNTILWQFGINPTHSWTPAIDGVGAVDVNYYFGSESELLEFSAPPDPLELTLEERVTALEALAHAH